MGQICGRNRLLYKEMMSSSGNLLENIAKYFSFSRVWASSEIRSDSLWLHLLRQRQIVHAAISLWKMNREELAIPSNLLISKHLSPGAACWLLTAYDDFVWGLQRSNLLLLSRKEQKGIALLLSVIASFSVPHTWRSLVSNFATLCTSG